MSAFDHVLLSDVFPYLLGAGIAPSRALRQGIIDNFARIARALVAESSRSKRRRRIP